MWFLKGRPSAITASAVVKSIDKGYQQTSLSVKFDAAVKLLIAIAYPYAPHKSGGSLKFTEDSPFSKIGAQVLGETDVTIYSRARDIKKVPDIDLFNFQEMGNWYVEDFGFITFWAEPGKEYQLNYTHKIAYDSQLFLPTRLPTFVVSGKPEIDYKLSIVGGNLMTVPPYLKLENSRADAVVKATFSKQWNWDLDTRFNTFNWESSDDGEAPTSDTE